MTRPSAPARSSRSSARSAGSISCSALAPSCKRVWDGFYVRPQSVTQEHNARFTLVDKKGFQRVGYPGFEATPERIAHDVRILQAE